MKSTLLVLYAETPLHAGSGVGLGAVDLPIQRERMSGLPMVQGSGIKGALRERMRPPTENERRNSLTNERGRFDAQDFLALFGPWAPKRKDDDEREDTQSGTQEDGERKHTPDEFAGALSVMDARLLLFPVRTAFGGFAWLTSPLTLDRLQRDLGLLGSAEARQALADLAMPKPGEGVALVTRDKESAVSRHGRLVIEDMDYTAKPESAVDALAEWLAASAFPAGDEYKPFRERIKTQLAVVSDTELTFLSKHATEVVARTSIDHNTGTVSGGALWTEESLPAETVLWTMAMFADSRVPASNDGNEGEQAEGKKPALKKREELCQRFIAAARDLSRIYLGGDRSVGRGMVGLRVVPDGQAGGGQ